MKKFLLRNMTMAFKICIIASCFLNVEKIFAQGTGFVKCYADKDSDGFGDPNDFVFIDVAFGCGGFNGTTGRIDNGLDCDDNDANEFPGQTWYKDLDGDSYTTGATIKQCERPAGYKTISELSQGFTFCGIPVNTLDMIDCDENTWHNSADFLFYFIDNDRDGAIASFDFIYSCSPPLDLSGTHYLAVVTGSDLCNLQQDCNDNNAFEKPGQEWYLDGDGDGFPQNNTPEFVQCAPPPGGFFKAKSQLVGLAEDCDDTDPALYPTVWYEDLDGDGISTGKKINACGQPDGYISLQVDPFFTDCDDTDPDATLEQPWFPDSKPY